MSKPRRTIDVALKARIALERCGIRRRWRSSSSAPRAQRVPGPHGGAWGPSTVAGNAARGTGLLNNELYIGRLVWNRLRYIKDPSTGRRVSRLNDPQQRVVVDAPELRIIDDELWQAVKARQANLTSKSEAKAAFWDRRRPRYLFSGLMRCGACGGGFAKISLHHFGCSTARNKGTCANLLTIRRDVLEATVLDALRHRLMDPELFKLFVAEFTAEWNRLQASAGEGLSARRSELAEVRRRIDGLIRAIEVGYEVVVVRAFELDDRDAVVRAIARIARYLVGKAKQREVRGDTSWFDRACERNSNPADRPAT